MAPLTSMDRRLQTLEEALTIALRLHPYDAAPLRQAVADVARLGRSGRQPIAKVLTTIQARWRKAAQEAPVISADHASDVLARCEEWAIETYYRLTPRWEN